MSSENPHKSKSGSIEELVEQCISHLTEVKRLTGDISRALEEERYGELESILAERGIRLTGLSNVEDRLNSLLPNSRDDRISRIMKEYIESRKTLFNTILEQDKNLNSTVMSMKDGVLKEMKNLGRGKKMHKHYLNNSSLSTGFVDIKE